MHLAYLPQQLGRQACQFCSGKWFYSASELFHHMHKEHYSCHICDKENEGAAQHRPTPPLSTAQLTMYNVRMHMCVGVRLERSILVPTRCS